ncbi:MAG: hypothetical protein JW882_13145 [Deltaproteobacteria bacterium]|nr:hypothetical protein [Deltaproteobacteria bacterium]
MTEFKYSKYVVKHSVVTRPEPGDGSKMSERIRFDGGKDFDSNFSLIVRPVTEPVLMEDYAHSHDFDMYVTFIGLDKNGLHDLGGEIEMYLGEDQEKIVITSPTTVYLPKGFVHCPLNFKRVDKPILLIHATIAAEYSK